MDKIKVERTTSFREWLMANDIQFIEQTQQYGLFHIYVNNELYAAVYATTEKMIGSGTLSNQKAWTGFTEIKRQILNWLPSNPDCALRKGFLQYKEQIKYARKLITVTELKSGALETQINDTSLAEKYQYIETAYDDQFCLKSCPEIRILGFIII